MKMARQLRHTEIFVSTWVNYLKSVNITNIWSKRENYLNFSVLAGIENIWKGIQMIVDG
jgi:hypothetical protein